MSKKEDFKYLINEFHTSVFPETFKRDMKIPLSTNKIITIYGPRRSGKTFYFYDLINDLINKGVSKNRILYLNFEDDRILPINFKELGLIRDAYFELYPENKSKEIFVFFDEIQNIKDWEIFIRRIYDKEKIKIFITGSSSKLLSKEIATSLRGRTLSFGIYPLNFGEFLKFNGIALVKNIEYSPERFKIKKMLDEYIQFGGFPEVILEKNDVLKKKILSEYFDSLVYRDLSDRFSLRNTEVLFSLLKYILTNVTSLFSVNSYYNIVKQNFPVSRDTIGEYLSFIQETEYINFNPQFSYSLKTQTVNPRKIICIDNGLRNAVAFKFSEDRGKLTENLVGNTLIKQCNEIYYWKNKGEVDFVIRDNDGLWAINVSFTNDIDDREIKSLLEFQQHFPQAKRLILITKDTEKKEFSIEFIPLWKWLLNL